MTTSAQGQGTFATPIPLIELIPQFAQHEWGFTGTRAGMNDFQRVMMKRLLVRGQPIIWRHGGARGADEDSHRVWKRYCRDSMAEVWPCDVKRAAIFKNDARVRVMAVMDPLERNVKIVKLSTFMIATPNKDFEVQRSGTWHTIRQAMQRNCPMLIIWPKSQQLTLFRDHTLLRVSYAILE